MKIKLSDYIAKRLKEFYGVNHLFMVSGGGAMHLNDSLGRFIPYIANHHEQACAIAAEGYARANQTLAVVNVTTGPGGLNCLNGVFGQWTDSASVLYISGQVKFSTTMASCPEVQLRQLGDQEVDIISVVKPLVKYAKMISEPNEIKYHLDRAIYEATTGRFGPVWLDIPMNVQGAMIDEEDLIDFVPPEKPNYDLKINEVIERLKAAKRPLIVAGHGIRLSGQEETFLKLLEKTQIPVVTTFNGVDAICEDHPCYIGRIGTIGQRAGNFALQNADLVICLGTRNNIRQASYNWENFAKNAFKIVVDIDSAELNKPTVVPDLKINADLKDFLPELTDLLMRHPEFISGSIQIVNDGKMLKRVQHDTGVINLSWLDWCKERKEKYSFENTDEYQQDGEMINPYYFIKLLTTELKKGDVLVSANATSSICIFQAGVVSGQRVLMNSGDASMGYALPASIGARLNSDGKVVCVEGDGSIMMNLQELQTIKHNNLGIKIFVLNNDGYISMKQTQKNFFDGRMTAAGQDSGVSTPDFVEIGKAFGLKTVRIEKSSELNAKISEVLNFDGPVFCEVLIKTDYAFTPKLSARKLADGTMVSPSLEDMFPFLDREELEENMIYE